MGELSPKQQSMSGIAASELIPKLNVIDASAIAHPLKLDQEFGWGEPKQCAVANEWRR